MPNDEREETSLTSVDSRMRMRQFTIYNFNFPSRRGGERRLKDAARRYDRGRWEWRWQCALMQREAASRETTTVTKHRATFPSLLQGQGPSLGVDQ
eukprot:scaffold161002_cov32-Tisochrysis_lutea.AAC.4